MNTITKLITIFFFFISMSSFANTYYVSPSGNDTNAGTQASPFATLQRAHQQAVSGDVVMLRGGTYTRFSISSSDANYNVVNTLTKNGISYVAFAGEIPVFNFSATTTAKRVTAFLVTGSNNTFQDFEVTGVPVGAQKQSECFRINSGSGNKLIRLRIHDCPAVGVYINNTASNTLVENCDAFNLQGTGASVGNIDGFGSHSKGGGNTFRGCRAWSCSDDGYDCIKAAGSVTFERCWAYQNGVGGGDGNGFKVGGWAASTPPNPLPVHNVRFCLSANNRSHGFYANHQPGQSANWYNNTAYNNAGGNYDMLERVSLTNATDIAGTREVMHNNIAFTGTAVRNLNESGSIVTNNTWTLSLTVSSSDFQGVDASQMTRARQANGSLPVIAFMHLASNSDLINAGQNVGLPFSGAAPDLGCFETGTANLLGAPVTAELTTEVAAAKAAGIYPTISTNYFTINSTGVFVYTIVNAEGQMMEKGKGRKLQSVGHNLPWGLYIITISTTTSSTSIRVMKK